MTNRRIRFDFKLRLQDICKVPAIVKEIEEMIRSHQQIDGVTHRLVGWREVGDYYASIWLSCYTKSTEQDIKLSHYIAVEQSVLERCTAIIYKHGADFASSTELTLRSNGLASAEILERQEAKGQDSKLQVRIAKEGQPVQSRERGFYESRNRVLQASEEKLRKQKLEVEQKEKELDSKEKELKEKEQKLQLAALEAEEETEGGEAVEMAT